MKVKERSGAGRIHGRLVAIVVAILLACACVIPASARQGAPPDLIEPGTQNPKTSTLELPAAQPFSPQGRGAVTIPPQVLQSQPQPQKTGIPYFQLRQQPGYEEVTVTVTDHNGGYVTGLKQDDFKLYIDGKPVPVQFLHQDSDTPVSVGIVVDTSGSMDDKLQQAEASIIWFLRDLDDQDDVFLTAFSSHVFLLQPFTTNHGLVMSRLKLLLAGGQTVLFDAIMKGLQTVRFGRYDKKAMLVVTDGIDETSVSYSLNDVIAQAKRMHVLVYSIGIGDPNLPGGWAGVIKNDEGVDAKTLTTLSTETGAKTFIINKIGDGAAMRTACETISREMQSQYTLGFVAPDPGAGGYRGVRVETPGKPGVEVRVRKGVEVGSR